MTGPEDFDEELVDRDDVDLAAPATIGRRRTGGDDWEVRYPRPEKAAPPAELGWRARRRWNKAAHRDRAAEVQSTVRSWSVDRPAGSTAGLGIVLAVSAAVFAAVVWWPTGGDDPRPADPAAAPATSHCGNLDSCGLPQTRNPRTGEPAPTASAAPTVDPAELSGSDDTAPAAPTNMADTADGVVAHDFLLAFNTYNPTLPADTWTASWSTWATPEFATEATSRIDRLWLFTVQDVVSSTGDQVTAGSPVDEVAGDDKRTWEVAVSRVLFPIGGTEGSDYSTQNVVWRVTLTGVDSGTPRVSDAQLVEEGPVTPVTAP